MDKLRPGMVYEHNKIVTEEDTAEAHGSGDLPVYATPALVALMEYAAKELVRPHLSEGETTVGVKMDISHLKATAVGGAVRARSELLEMEGRRLHFRIEAYEGEMLIGEAIHDRVVVDAQKFMSKFSK